ncbi:MAG: MinD/ParA family protein [Nanoarchaeota archaeon]
MGKVIGIIAIKGGVGKTTISASLASDLANHYGKKVLLIDANYSAPNLGLHMDIVDPETTIHDVLAGKTRISRAVHPRYGVDVVPGSYSCTKKFNPLKLRDKIAVIKKNYDFIIIDSSPSLNEELLSTMLASDNLFLVSTPDYPTLSCALRAIKLARQRDKHILGIILNKIRDPDYEISLKYIEEITGLPVIARIFDDSINTRALFNRIPSSLYSRHSKFSKEINKLSAAITNCKEKKSIWKSLVPLDFRREEVNRQILKKAFSMDSESLEKK